MQRAPRPRQLRHGEVTSGGHETPLAGVRRTTFIRSPAAAIAAQLHYWLGAGSHARVARATTIDGEPAYVLVLSALAAAGNGVDQPVWLASGPVVQPGSHRQLRVGAAGTISAASRATWSAQDPAG